MSQSRVFCLLERDKECFQMSTDPALPRIAGDLMRDLCHCTWFMYTALDRRLGWASAFAYSKGSFTVDDKNALYKMIINYTEPIEANEVDVTGDMWLHLSYDPSSDTTTFVLRTWICRYTSETSAVGYVPVGIQAKVIEHTLERLSLQ